MDKYEILKEIIILLDVKEDNIVLNALDSIKKILKAGTDDSKAEKSENKFLTEFNKFEGPNLIEKLQMH